MVGDGETFLAWSGWGGFVSEVVWKFIEKNLGCLFETFLAD